MTNKFVIRLFVCLLFFLSVSTLQAADATSDTTPITEVMDTGFQAKGTPSLVTQAIALTAMAVLPFLLMLVTPFAKMVMVFSLLRNALGVQQVPPNQVINGIALILSMFIIFPVGLQMLEKAEPVLKNSPESLFSQQSPEFIIEVAKAVREPFSDFIMMNTKESHRNNFFRIALKMMPERFQDRVDQDSLIIMIPAYITTQVKNGFEIGVLIYLPFFVIDLVVANILLAMGMMMLSPITISMPLKIFLLVMLDGWTLLTQGLINSYVTP